VRALLQAALLAALALWGQGAPAAASGPAPAPTLGALSVAPQAAPAAPGWRLNLPGKSPLVLPALDAAGSLYPVKEAAVYGGLTVTWRSSARLLLLQTPDGRSARLLVDDAWLYDGGTRVALPRPLTLAAGAPALDEAGLRLLLQRLSSPTPAFEAASAEELAAARQALAPPLPAAVPTLQPAAEPELVPTSPVSVAARPLTGGRIRTVVIDAGHGGHDPGALGRRGLREKDVCLDIAVYLREELQRLDKGLRVVLTRDKDVYLTLRQRTEVANQADGDLFISIHNNASRNRSSRGTQVFFYDSQSSDKAAADLAMRENEDANQLEILMTDLAKSLVRDQSIAFASKVQAELGKALRLPNRDLSYAPFYVLARTKMPAILVEVAFISNAQEEALLRSTAFRKQVAGGIARGVAQYRRLVEEAP
jgi:N-acetylmuramoyl-L-alanine amidase